MRIKIQVLPSDNVAQCVEHRRDMLKDLSSNSSECNFFICSVVFFLSLLPWRSVGMSNFDWGLLRTQQC